MVPLEIGALIGILEVNRLMRSPDEVAAFEQALAELAQHPSHKYLPDLHLVLDDQCQQPEVMFSLIHFLESFDVKEQLQAFIEVVPRLVVRAAEWTSILHSRILNDAVACAAYEEILQSVDFKERTIVCQLLTEIAANKSSESLVVAQL